MNTDLEQCEQLARQLPLQERSVLLSRLISSLDELNESECENLWLKEAGRRYREYKEGNIYSLLYSNDLDEIVIIAVMHQKQRPYYWLARL